MGGWTKDNKVTALGCVAGANPKLNDLDMAARRLLRGMGMKIDGLTAAEQRICDATYSDETYWSRTVRLWTLCNKCRQFKQLVFVDTLKDTVVKPVMEQEYKPGVVYVHRKVNDCTVYFAIPSYDALELKPPFAVIGSIANNWVVQMDLTHFGCMSTL